MTEPPIVSRGPELLARDEPGPFEVVDGDERSPYVVICDHASRRIPRALAGLGLEPRELERHIAWDIGVAELGRKLASRLGAWLILQNYSRLVIDCNRPRTSPDSIAASSEGTVVPGNVALPSAEAERRALAIFEPYHARIRRELDERAARGQGSVLIFLHTFTPTFRGVGRAWHAGVLYQRDSRVALPLLAALRGETALVVGENEPYAAGDLTDYGLVEHGERRRLPHVEIEVRQDIVAGDRGQNDWAERLARRLKESNVFPT